jgi:transcriptional antiterminator NusG
MIASSSFGPSEFSKGDRVRIKEQPFENYRGTIDEVFIEMGVARVFVLIFGRETPLELKFGQLEKVGRT